jgi:hypothetical protein
MALKLIFDRVLVQYGGKYKTVSFCKNSFFQSSGLLVFQAYLLQSKGCLKTLFFMEMLRIKFSTNSESFIEIGNHFCMTEIWIRRLYAQIFIAICSYSQEFIVHTAGRSDTLTDSRVYSLFE